jgi:hypothetical protein
MTHSDNRQGRRIGLATQSPWNLYAKSRYTQINIDILQQEPSWWWKGIWKIKCPLKSHIFLWCLIKNKVPTWDRMKLRGLEGPGWCPLCKGAEETSIVIAQVVGWENPNPTTKQVLQLGNPTPNVTSM